MARYFKHPHYYTGILLIVLGLTGIAVGAAQASMGNFLIGGGICLIGFLYILIRRLSIAKDAKIEDIYQQMRSQPHGEVMEVLGLSAADMRQYRQLFFCGCTSRDVPAPVVERTGGDLKLRTSNYVVTLMYFTHDHIYCYSTSQSLVEERYLTEAKTLAYKDLVSVENSCKISSKGVPGINGVSEFTFITSNGSSLTVPYDSSDARQLTQLKAIFTLLHDKGIPTPQAVQAPPEKPSAPDKKHKKHKSKKH